MDLGNAELNAKEAERCSAELIQQLMDSLQVCNVCNSMLNQDEKIINTRFIQQAVESGQDISVFPICVKCNFE